MTAFAFWGVVTVVLALLAMGLLLPKDNRDDDARS